MNTEQYKKIVSAGYSVVFSECKMYFDLVKDHNVMTNILTIDCQDIIDMIEDKHDLTLEIAYFNPADKPMIDCDFYKWLKSNNKANFHTINDINEYLSGQFGFIRGVHIVQSDVIRTLKYIGQHYFDKECK